eukprot:m.356771 g.356771  ORF g.356771 m.356771 type:complete len:66 (-) comp16607_c0_seq7:21-218(-)
MPDRHRLPPRSSSASATMSAPRFSIPHQNEITKAEPLRFDPTSVRPTLEAFAASEGGPGGVGGAP